MADLRRTALGMLAVGALLAGARSSLSAPAELVPAVDDQALLFEQGLAAGWVRTDPVVRARLVDNMRFVGRSGTDAELFEAALALGMHRTDPVVRLHLTGRARRALEAVREPSDAELRELLEAHPERFEREPVLELEQRMEDGLVMAIEPRISGTASQLARRFGIDREALGSLTPGDQVALRSAYGLHRIRVIRRTGGGLPELSAIRAQVRAAWQADERDRVVEARMAALRAEALR